MRIAFECMGGDYAPYETVRGAVLAAREYQVEIILVGDKSVIREELIKCRAEKEELITIKHAPETIKMDEHPAIALRKKPNSSIVVANALVKEGKADAVVSMGNTGAAMAASLFGLGRIEGIDRPAIAIMIPTVKGFTVLLDAGANVDCKAHHLQQFAIMGSLYAEKMLGILNPTVGLINIGSEENKGNELTKSAYVILKETSYINFIGNVESRELHSGDVDVVVCDGFVGNVILKTMEGMAVFLYKVLNDIVYNKLQAEIDLEKTVKVTDLFKQHIDYSQYGGAPLLGVNGISIIGHGSSKAHAVKNAIRVAKDAVSNNLVKSILKSIKEISC